ncbi:MAG: condensation domain-containing protein, partial [Bacteroidota bacterium]
GDLARWLPDGNVEFLGRIDNQVKIHGFRIELGEIETILQQTPSVQQGVVLAKADARGDKRLVAYVVTDTAFDANKIRNFLKRHLPQYMVPHLILCLDQMPLSPNHKIDKQALPDPSIAQFEQQQNQYVAPSNLLEQRLVEIWEKLLQIHPIGVQANFFELGGHSLLATQVISAIREQLQYEISIPDLFESPTIVNLARHLTQLEQKTAVYPLRPFHPRPQQIPLSFAQKQLWVIDQLEGSTHYHMPIVFRLKGPLEVNRLSNTFRTIVNRHEVLRTVFKTEQGKAHQVVLPTDQWTLQQTMHSSLPSSNSIDQWIAQSINRPFDLSEDHMLRAELLQLEEEDYLLVLVFHHIAADGWSISIFMEEWETLYTTSQHDFDHRLSPLSIQYADYTLWQQQQISTEYFNKKLDYWEAKLAALPPLQLPIDFSRPAVKNNQGKILPFHLNQKIQEQLNTLAQEKGATLFMLLLTAIKVLLYRYTHQKDICVGSPAANRTPSTLEPLIGYFLNTLALRSDLDGKPTFLELLQQVKQTTLEAYQHQEVPFNQVVDRVKKTRDRSQEDLFQVMFVLQNNPNTTLRQLGEVQMDEYPFAYPFAKFELTFAATEQAQGIDFELEYRTDLFQESSMQNMIAHFCHLLNSILQTPEQRIDQLPLLSTAQQKEQLAFNPAPVVYPSAQYLLGAFDRQA